MSATHRSWNVEEVCTAIRTAFPGVPPERLTQTAFAVEEEHGDTEVGPPPEHYAEESVEDDITDEIDAIVQAAEPIDEADAVEILATWKQTRTAMTKEKLDRGLRPQWKARPGQGGHGGPTRHDLDKLGRRVKCFRCKKIGHFSRDCKEPLPAHSSQMVFVEPMDEEDQEEARVQAVLGAAQDDEIIDGDLDDEINSILKVHEDNVLAKLIQQERWKRLAHEMKEQQEDEYASVEKRVAEEGTVLGVTHADGCPVPDTGCCKSLIGEETLTKHEAATGKKARWLKDAKPMRFRGFDNSVQESVGAVELDWEIKNFIVTFVVYVVPGSAGFLMSKPDMKALGAALDLETDSLYLKRLGLTIPMSETVAGHYEIDFLNREKKVKRQAHTSSVRVRDVGSQSLDKVHGWDVDKDDDYNAMWQHIIEDEPYFVHMCPPCRKLSIMQQCMPLDRRKDLAQHFRDVKWSVNLVHVVVEVAIYQMERGRHFVYETPPRCASLQVPVMKQLLQTRGVYVGIASGCEFGLRCPDTLKLMPKSWEFVTSAPEVAKAVHQRCGGGHEHQHTEGMLKCGIKRTVFSQRYPKRLVEAIVRGMRRQCQVEAFSSEAACKAVQGEEEDADETRDVLRRPHSSIESSLRKLHVQLGHCKNNVLIRHLRHAHATEQAIKAANDFYCPECEGMKCPKVARHSTPAETHLPLKYVSMDCKDLPSWIPGERITCLGIIDETSSLHQVEPMIGMAETSKNLMDAFERAWIRPYIRPKWLKVDPHRAQISDEFLNWCERQGIEAELRTKMVNLEHYSGQREKQNRFLQVQKFQHHHLSYQSQESENLMISQLTEKTNPQSIPPEGDACRTVSEAYQPMEGQMDENREEQDEAKRPRLEEQTTIDDPSSSQQQFGGVTYPPSLPSPPLRDSANAHLARDVDEDVIVNEVDVLLTQGSKEINTKEDKWKSPEGLAMIEKAYTKEMTSLVHETKAWKPVDLEKSRLLKTQDYTLKGYHPEQLFEVVNGYGLGDQPQQWWRTFERYMLEELKFDQHPMDPCVFLLREPVTQENAGLVAKDRVSVIPYATGSESAQLRGEPGALCGILGVHVDDQINGGRGQLWATAMKKLRARFPFRKWVTGSGEFTGSVLTQRADYSIAQSQSEYTKGITPAKTRKSARPDDVALPSEVHNHISTTQQGNWLAGQTRPDLSCQISFSQQIMPHPTVGQIRRSNAWVRRAKQFHEISVTFQSIVPERLRFVCHSDYSSKDLDGTGRTQGGYIIGATDPSMAKGLLAPWCPLVWKSQKIKQGCTSTLAGESKLLKASLGHLEWIMCSFAATLYPAFCLENRDRYSRKFSAISVIDCKSVFDHVTKPGAPTGLDDKKASIDIAIAKGSLRRFGGTLRWGPTELMLGDALTKDKAEAADVLRACMRAGAYQLADESAWAMVKFEATGSDEQARAFLLGLVDVYPDVSSYVESEARVKVRVPAKTLLGAVQAKKGNTPVTLQYVANTGNIQVMTGVALEDEIRDKCKVLERAYASWQRAPLDQKPKLEIKSPATEFFRSNTVKASKKEIEQDGDEKITLPDDEGYSEAMDAILESVGWSLSEYPVMRDRILKTLQMYVPDGEEETSPKRAQAVGEDDDGTGDWQMGDSVKVRK
ncbi:unnamed protein product [Prorocentrum cordatum]|uniref:CCHC-type domain-containing protein n=1 Tax=Prorocentrum cordatum TaxID=2364126 RepID=A0ABN9UR49_9DINO|nr:unnamed protein product [Polarella glacialis]